MPYITKEKKHEFLVNEDSRPTNAGELNYFLTMICMEYIQNNGMNYQKLNDVIGALEGCKLEFYRRTVTPYENSKISINGDVYDV